MTSWIQRARAYTPEPTAKTDETSATDGVSSVLAVNPGGGASARVGPALPRSAAPVGGAYRLIASASDNIGG